MSKTILIPVLFAVLFQSCAQNNDKKTAPIRQQPKVATSFQLTDFLSDNADLTAATDKVFASLDDTAIVAQLIMPAVGRLGQTEETIKAHIKSRIIGGVLLFICAFNVWVIHVMSHVIGYLLCRSITVGTTMPLFLRCIINGGTFCNCINIDTVFFDFYMLVCP